MMARDDDARSAAAIRKPSANKIKPQAGASACGFKAEQCRLAFKAAMQETENQKTIFIFKFSPV
jgi:hypothetical protein